uniref:BTB domain-containing protein n=1 Tax=Panagrellus redivivus TaxID=6233 RepID=A0A7E4UTN4_PANRE
MSIAKNHLLEQIGSLCLNAELSDVTIVVEGIRLPAHRVILARRCEYFKNMFESGMIEATTKRIEIRETPLNGFKNVLKWIYTGYITVFVIEDAFEVIRLAHMYQITELVDIAIDYFKGFCSVENVCSILNEAVILSHDQLTDLSIDFVTANCCKVLKHESFETLSKDALTVMLIRAIVTALEIDVFHAVIGWMKANPLKSADFPDIIKYVPLGNLAIEELKNVPSELVDSEFLIALANHQRIVSVPPYQMQNENVATSKNGVKVFSGGETSFFKNTDLNTVLKHDISSSYGHYEQGIIVDLGRRYLLNSFKMLLVDNYNGLNFSCNNYKYWIAVSEDNCNYTRVVDHSKYSCCNLQNLYFKERFARFIRICGTAPVDGAFAISRLEALYTTELVKIDPVTQLQIPFYNVASVTRNAVIRDEFSGSEFYSSVFLRLHGGVIVQLPQPYLIDSMNLLLHENANYVYNYKVEVSVNLLSWTCVFSEKKVSAWRKLHFRKQPVVFVKISGLSSYDNLRDDRIQLECFAKS